MRWSLSAGISRRSGNFFKPQKCIILKESSAHSNKPIKSHCPSRFQQIGTTSIQRRPGSPSPLAPQPLSLPSPALSSAPSPPPSSSCVCRAEPGRSHTKTAWCVRRAAAELISRFARRAFLDDLELKFIVDARAAVEFYLNFRLLRHDTMKF